MGEPAFRSGSRIAGYVLGERLGAGGFGEVFAAEHETIKRKVAIKILNERYSRDASAVARFEAEARAVNVIGHPRIVEVFDYGVASDGRAYVVMERLVGETLAALLGRRTHLELEEALPLLTQIADAIAAAHAVQIAHRDLKPENVFLLADGSIKLIDFGLAKLVGDTHESITQSGAVLGSPRYMSPEQCRGKNLDTRTDIYSFGALAYHVLTGRTPFEGDALALALAHLNETPKAPSQVREGLPGRVDAALLALLAKDPADRPPIRSAIDALQGTASLPARRSRTVRRAIVAACGIAVATAASIVLVCSPQDGAVQHFRQRALPLQTTGVIQFPPLLSADGSTLFFTDAAADWKFDIATGSQTRLPFASRVSPAPTPNGRLVYSREGRVFESDASGGGETALFEGWHPSSSPDGHLVAAWHGRDQLVILDRRSKQVRTVEDTTGLHAFGAPNWSADSRRILFTAVDVPGTQSVRLTSLDTNTTRILAVPSIVESNPTGGAAFLPDERFIYCREDATGISIRSRRLDDANGASETVLVPLDTTVSGCSFASIASGRTVATIIYGRSTNAALDLAATGGEFRPIASPTGTREIAGLSDDGRVLWAYGPERSLYETAVDTGAERTVATCPGERAIVTFANSVLHAVEEVDATGVTVSLRSGTCVEERRWRLNGAGWSPPTCRRETCVALRSVGERHTLAFLRANGTVDEVATFTAPELGALSLALGPDASTAAVRTGGAAPVVVSSTGEVQSARIPEDFYVGSIAWSKSGLLAAGRISSSTYGIYEIDTRAAPRLLWRSDTTGIERLTSSPGTSVVVGHARSQRQSVLLLEPE